MFNISKHIFSHFEFFALGASEPDFVLPHLELDAVAQFVTAFDVQIISASIDGDGWALCDITRVPSLCYKVIIQVAEPVVKTPPKRNFYSDAMFIQGGACNPRAIVNTIQEFMKGPLSEVDTDYLRANPGLRLMVHQLAHLMSINVMESRPLIYTQVTEACEILAQGKAITLGRHYWHGLNGDLGGLSFSQQSGLKDFLQNYPAGQKFKVLTPQFDTCVIDGKKCPCYLITHYEGE